MLKHVGKHNDRKVVVLFRQVPNEDHMCLIAYSDLLPRLMHDEIMRSLESPVGQQAENLADALFRASMADGRNVLEVLHKEGFMKKVPTSQVIITPTPSAKIRLDELNTILAEMSKGDDAVKRMAELDSQAGLQKKKRDNTPAKPITESAPTVPALQAGPNDVLTDDAIAAQQIAQASRMRAEATSLLAEASRLESEAAALAPSVVKTTKTASKAKSSTAPAVIKATTNDTSQKAKKAKV